MRLALALALASLVAAPAAAQDRSAQDRGAQDRGAQDMTHYEFLDGDLVEGGRYDPSGSWIQGTRRRAHRTLIRARAHFIPEMLRSVERL